MKRKRLTKILPRKFEPAPFAVPGNAKLKLPSKTGMQENLLFIIYRMPITQF